MTTGIDQLRSAVAAYAYCNESFLQQFTAAELLTIRACWLASEWDFFPDQWTTRQLREALEQGRAPTWSARTEKPTYAKVRK